MKRHHRNALAAIALLGMAQSASADVIVDWNIASVALGQAVAEQVSAARSSDGANASDTNRPHNRITIVPDGELELLGVSVDHKTWEAPDGTIYQCDSGFYAIKVKDQGTIWCNGKEL